MDSGSFMQRVCELTGFDRERSELLVRETLVMLGTRTSPGEADSPTILRTSLCADESTGSRAIALTSSDRRLFGR
jgi:hypothetical protein